MSVEYTVQQSNFVQDPIPQHRTTIVLILFTKSKGKGKRKRVPSVQQKAMQLLGSQHENK